MKNILTINGGSSSIKFAVFEPGDPPRLVLKGQVERIGMPDALLTVSIARGALPPPVRISAADHNQAANQLIDWMETQFGPASFGAVGHRIVHGGVHPLDHQRVTAELIAELRKNQPLDLAHLPREIALIEVVGQRMESLPQVACFDTAFHRDMPRVAQLLPIPRKYDAAGLRRFGFHGISYSYLLGELGRIAGEQVNGKIIFAHLGSGASMAAVSGGKPVDTTMGFTPLSGLVMGTRPGDLDPGLLVYLMRVENMSAERLDDFLSHDCGLIGISDTSSDMRDLTERRSTDVRAAEAVALFCYRARQWIGALAVAMGGLDMLVFSGGIGQHAADVRSEICQGLEFLGISLDATRNSTNAGIISAELSRVSVRVIATDEEIMIARSVMKIVGS